MPEGGGEDMWVYPTGEQLEHLHIGQVNQFTLIRVSFVSEHYL